MKREADTIFDDDALVHAIGKLKYRRVGRLLVLNRGSGALVGLITKGDVAAGLLEALHVAAETDRQAAAAPLLEDLSAGATSLALQRRIRCGSIENGGEVASGLRKALKRLGVRQDLIRRAAIVLYEAEMNVMIYADEGEALVRLDGNTILVEVTDRGRGIPDIARAMEPGFSTAPDSVRALGFGAGMGLPNIKKCSDSMDLSSVVGEGTRLAVTIAMGERPGGGL